MKMTSAMNKETRRLHGNNEEGKREGELKLRLNAKKGIWKVGTWNVRSIAGKELEIVDEFEQTGLEIMALTETKKKGRGQVTMDKGHIFIYSGVKIEERAAGGVGCIIHRKMAEQVYKWEGRSERILMVELRDRKKCIKTLIIVYGPNEDDTTGNKEKFWEELAIITEDAKGKIIIMGDFNSRVGNRDETYKAIIGTHGESIRNNNGERLLDFCLMHDLIVTNSFLNTEIYTSTREK